MASPQKTRPEDVLGEAPALAPDVWTAAVKEYLAVLVSFQKNGPNPICKLTKPFPTWTGQAKTKNPNRFFLFDTRTFYLLRNRPPPASRTTRGSFTRARTPTTRRTRGWTLPPTARRCRSCRHRRRRCRSRRRRRRRRLFRAEKQRRSPSGRGRRGHPVRGRDELVSSSRKNKREEKEGNGQKLFYFRVPPPSPPPASLSRPLSAPSAVSASAAVSAPASALSARRSSRLMAAICKDKMWFRARDETREKKKR